MQYDVVWCLTISLPWQWCIVHVCGEALVMTLQHSFNMICMVLEIHRCIMTVMTHMTQYDTVWYSMMHYDTVIHMTVMTHMTQYDTVWCIMTQWYIWQYDTVWHSMTQYDALWSHSTAGKRPKVQSGWATLRDHLSSNQDNPALVLWSVWKEWTFNTPSYVIWWDIVTSGRQYPLNQSHSQVTPGNETGLGGTLWLQLLRVDNTDASVPGWSLITPVVPHSLFGLCKTCSVSMWVISHWICPKTAQIRYNDGSTTSIA